MLRKKFPSPSSTKEKRPRSRTGKKSVRSRKKRMSKTSRFSLPRRAERKDILFRSLFLEDLHDRAAEDLEVEEQGAMLDVIELHVDPFRVVDAGTAVAGPIAGDAGTDREQDLAGQSVAVGLLVDDRTGSDQGHRPQKDVEELRKLIQGGLPQKLSEGGDPRIVVDLEFPSELLQLLLRQLLLDGPVVDLHRPELVHVEDLSLPSDSLVLVDHRPLRGALDQDGQDQVEPAEKEQESPGHQEVEEALEEGIDGFLSKIVGAVDRGLDLLYLQGVLPLVDRGLRLVGCHVFSFFFPTGRDSRHSFRRCRRCPRGS